MNLQDKLNEYRSKRAEMLGAASRSKLSAHEQMSLLFDERSFVELGAFVRQRPIEDGKNLENGL